MIAKGGIEAAVQMIIQAVIHSYQEALQWLRIPAKPGECAIRGAPAHQA